MPMHSMSVSSIMHLCFAHVLDDLWGVGISVLYALSMWQPSHVVCIVQLHPPKCQAICIYTIATVKCALTCAGRKHRPCLLLCSYKVHKIQKKKIENPELVDPVHTPGVASSMQQESGQQSNVRLGSVQNVGAACVCTVCHHVLLALPCFDIATSIRCKMGTASCSSILMATRLHRVSQCCRLLHLSWPASWLAKCTARHALCVLFSRSTTSELVQKQKSLITTKVLELLNLHRTVIQYNNINIEHNNRRMLACASAVLLHTVAAPISFQKFASQHLPCSRVSEHISVIMDVVCCQIACCCLYDNCIWHNIICTTMPEVLEPFFCTGNFFGIHPSTFDIRICRAVLVRSRHDQQ